MNFAKAKNTYRKNAVVQSKMAKKLAYETKLRCGNNFKNIFEIGSGTGLLTDEIVLNFNSEKIFLNDLTDNYTKITPFRYYKGNILDIDCKTFFDFNSTDNLKITGFDLIMSNAAFQWIEDKKSLFSKIFNLMNPNGILAFTTFGAENFNQIKDIIGFSLDYKDLTPYIEKAGFKILYFEEELETLYFKDVRNILEHIKLTGAGSNANCLWTRHKYELFKKKYLEKFSDNNGVELTYHPLYFICKKA